MFFRQCRIWSSHVFILKRMAKKCTKIYNTPTAVGVVVFLKSLTTSARLLSIYKQDRYM